MSVFAGGRFGRRFARAFVVAAAAAAILVPSAIASGGLDSGGSGGGGGGGGGTPSPVLAPCAQISSFKATGGNYRSWGAIWVSYTVKNCGPDGGLTITVTETTDVDPTYSWVVVAGSGLLKTGSSYSVSNLDNDIALPGTTYHVQIKVTDPVSGAVLATQSVDATTGVKVGP